VADKNQIQELELKRVVMVKAIVTPAFKENLVKELERAVRNLDLETQRIEEQSKQYMQNLKSKGLDKQLVAFRRQLQEERARQAAAKNDLLNKIEQANGLTLNTEFIQGPLEGPVNVVVGDNLYKKVGGAEIIVKDGVIQEIRGVE
jgi:uncharacterized protein (UPF0335 family)